MRRIAPLGYWLLRLMHAGCILGLLWVVAIILAYLTLGGIYAVVALLVAFIHLAILRVCGWTRYYLGDPMKSRLAYPENDE